MVSAEVGGRNHALFLASIALGQLVGADLLTDSDALEVLRAAARSQAQAPGEDYDQRQVEATIRSGFDRGLREPRQLRTAHDRKHPPTAARRGARPGRR